MAPEGAIITLASLKPLQLLRVIIASSRGACLGLGVLMSLFRFWLMGLFRSWFKAFQGPAQVPFSLKLLNIRWLFQWVD